MGLLDKLTGRNSPAYKKSVETRSAQIRAEADAVSAQMAEEFRKKREANEASAKVLLDQKDEEINRLLREAGMPSLEEIKNSKNKE